MPCFDFEHPNLQNKKPLQEAIPLIAEKDAFSSGKDKEKNFIWGKVRGIVHKSIARLYEMLLDPYTIKDRQRVKLKIYDQPHDGFQNFNLVMVSAITPLANIDWEENWGYSIIDGTMAQPKTILINYQKTVGTEFIPHMCGSMVLKSIDSTTTDVYLYEEVNALGKRSPQDTVKGHLGTLTTLRK